MKFLTKLANSIRESSSVLCIGLDPNSARLPAQVRTFSEDPVEQVVYFCHQVIQVTEKYCAAFKPNVAFFEALGPHGLDAFNRVVSAIPKRHIIIADAKRGDISTTAEHYKLAFFDQFKVDAITLNPLMGMETLEAFNGDSSKAVYALALTSNAGAQDFLLARSGNFESLSAHIAHQLANTQKYSETHLGMVIGATQSQVAQQVLALHPKAALLIPGFGAQGGDIESLATLLATHSGLPLINSSRGILFDVNDNKDNDSAHGSWQDRVLDRTLTANQRLLPIFEQVELN